MIDHLSLRVSDFDRSLAFYQAALAPLGYRVMMQFPGMAGLGATSAMPDFWVTRSLSIVNATHVAFAADRAAVRAFHAAGLAAGGTDSGAPGPRPDYHPNYYAAFILDPDGNVIEAVSHKPEGAKTAAAKKPTAKKPAAKKPAKKPAAKKPAKKPAAKKPAKKPAAKKPARKPAAKGKAAKKKPAKRS